jgi:guanylate kinase
VTLGTLFIIAAPSGAGKTTLVRALTRRIPNIRVSVSHTTRPQRSREEDGVNYHFVDENTFKDMVDDECFLEHAEVFGYHYGTSADWVQEQLKAGTDVILEIDWQGAQQVRACTKNSVSIFILPPSLEALRERLMKRNQDDPEVIARRLAEAKTEMSHCHEFDYVVINQYFQHALRDLTTIIRASRLCYRVQAQYHHRLLEDLAGE